MEFAELYQIFPLQHWVRTKIIKKVLFPVVKMQTEQVKVTPSKKKLL